MASPAFFNDFNKPVETVIDDDYSLAKVLKTKFTTSNGLTITSKNEYTKDKKVTGDITGKGKHKSGFSVDKLQIKPEGGTVGEFALVGAAPGLTLTFKGDDKPNGWLGAEYVGPRYAVKAETDILKMDTVKASGVFAQKGAKVGGDIDAKLNGKVTEINSWRVGAGYGTPKAFASVVAAKKGAGALNYTAYGLYKCTPPFTVAAKATCTPSVSYDFILGGVYKSNPKTTIKSKVNLDAVVTTSIIQEVLEKVQLVTTVQVPIKSVADYKAGLGVTLG